MKQSPDSASLRYSAPAIPDMIGTYAMSAQVQTTRSRARRRQLQWWRRIVRCLGRRRADPQFTSHLSKCPRLIFAVILATLCAASLSAQTATAHRQPEQRAPGFVPIYAIQGDGLTSPLSKSRVDTYGIVTAVTSNGFYLQDPIGDGLDATSDALFVYTRTGPNVTVGACVALYSSFVDEYYEKTELTNTRQIESGSMCAHAQIRPVPLAPAQLYSDPVALFERFEGMLVQVDDLTGRVLGPTKRFNDGSAEVAFVLESYASFLRGGRIFQYEEDLTSALMYVSSTTGMDVPEVNQGDLISLGAAPGPDDALLAVLDYNFGKYQLTLLDGYTVEALVAPHAQTSAPRDDRLLRAGDDPDLITICSFNVLGLGSGSAQYAEPAEYQHQLNKRALAIAENLRGCTIIGLQETGEPADVEKLAALLRIEHGLDYEATAIAGPGTSNLEFPLTNSLLSLRSRVVVQHAELIQGCSRLNYDVRFTPGSCASRTYALFNRPPLVVDLSVSGAWGAPYDLTVIVNHWKSKGGDEEVNLIRRHAQAKHVAALAQTRIDRDAEAGVVVLGDLNDYYESGPVNTVRQTTEPNLVHTFDLLPRLDRYTYIFNGASQVLDHILVTAAMVPDVSAVQPLHINADFATPALSDATSVHHSSDHDPVAIVVRPTGATWVGGEWGYPAIRVTLRDEQGAIVSEGVSDDAGAFRLWDVAPGDYDLLLDVPMGLVSSSAARSITVEAGGNWVDSPGFSHQSAELGIAAALFAPLHQLAVSE